MLFFPVLTDDGTNSDLISRIRFSVLLVTHSASAVATAAAYGCPVAARHVRSSGFARRPQCLLERRREALPRGSQLAAPLAFSESPTPYSACRLNHLGARDLDIFEFCFSIT